MKSIFITLVIAVLSTTCSAKSNLVDENNSSNSLDSETFTLKKNESKEIGKFSIRMLSVGHTFGTNGHSVYAKLEITGNGTLSKPTIYLGMEIPLGDKYLKLISVDERSDPKLSDPFSSNSCTLAVNEKPTVQSKKNETSLQSPTDTSQNSKIKPTLSKVKYAKIRLGYGKKSAIVDLDDANDITLGGNEPHRFKPYFATIKNNKIYYLFEVRSGSAMSNPSGFCGGDSPQTLVWLKTDLNLKVEEVKSEVFASCAYNGGRYLQGKIQITFSGLRIVFEQQKTKSEINYDNLKPENGFEVKELR